MKNMKTFMMLGKVVLFLLLFSACSSSPKVPELKAVHPEKWAEIEQYIHDNWLKYVDTVPSMPKPYSYALNPGTLYYWDVYFINEGLMIQKYWEQAQNNLDCFIFEIEKLGFIPNANRWGEDRSMTPLFAMMVKSFYEKSPKKDQEWLARAYSAVVKEYEFWINTNGNTIEDHSTAVPGLQRFSHHSDSAKVIRFYDKVVQGRFRLEKDAPIEVKLLMGGNRLAEAESGMDFTPRFDGRIMDFIPVELNSNLYQYEKVLAWLEQTLKISDGKAWEKKAEERAQLIRQYLWNEERGLFLDYDFVNKKHTPIASIVTLWPLYWEFATKKEAERIVNNLSLFDSEGGMVVCEQSEQPILYQWGDAAVWAPMQFLTIGALDNYKYKEHAQYYALKWLNTVTSNFVSPQPATHRPFKFGDGTRSPGFLYEKYKRDGTINDNEYPCSIMMGWTAATFLRAKQYITQ